jgi:hypothetical protein
MKPEISVLGAGRMGSALARAFLEKGYETSVWNRTQSKLAPLAALGARIAPSLQEAVAAAGIVVVNLNDYVTTDRLLRSDGVASGLRGKLLVQLTSGSPRQAREMAAWTSCGESRRAALPATRPRSRRSIRTTVGFVTCSSSAGSTEYPMGCRMRGTRSFKPPSPLATARTTSPFSRSSCGDGTAAGPGARSATPRGPRPRRPGAR